VLVFLLGINSYNEAAVLLTRILADLGSQCLGRVFGILPAGEHEPEIGLFGALDQTGGAIEGLHLAAQALSVGAVAESAHLDRKRGGGYAFGRADYFHANPGRAGADHFNLAGRPVREVNDTAVDERATVGDANLNSLIVFQIVNPDPRVEGECPVGRRELFHVVNLPIGGRPAVVGFAVPT